MRAFVTTIIFLALFQGCTSFKTVDSEPTGVTVSNLAIGDEVQIVTTDGEKVRLTIEAIEDDTLIGDGVRVPIKDIRIVSIRRIDSGKTTAASITTVGIVIGALVVVAVSILVP